MFLSIKNSIGLQDPTPKMLHYSSSLPQHLPLCRKKETQNISIFSQNSHQRQRIDERKQNGKTLLEKKVLTQTFDNYQMLKQVQMNVDGSLSNGRGEKQRDEALANFSQIQHRSKKRPLQLLDIHSSYQNKFLKLTKNQLAILSAWNYEQILY